MTIKLNRKRSFAADVYEMDRIIESLNRLLDEKVDVESKDYLENISAILNFQAYDGSFNLLDSFRVESDVRVDYCFMPTYICTAILMKVYLHGDEDLKIKVRQALADALKTCTWRNLRGHGYEALSSQIKAIKIFMKGGVREFLAYHKDLCLEFADMILSIKEEYRSMVKNQTFFGSWGESYEEGIKTVDEYLSHSNVFVYGTLLSGEHNHDYYLSDSPCIGRSTLTGYDMYDIGSFPGIVLGEGEIFGEVYNVSEETLEELDYLEGEGSLYIRKLVEVTMETGEKILASIYVYNRSIDGLETIPVWLQPYTSEWRDKMKDHVWYVAYGSNMFYDRFKHYIKGGQYEGGGAEHDPCEDTTPPRAKKNYEIPYPMYFAKESPYWDDKAVSFLDLKGEGTAHGVAYLITRKQFLHVACQENGKQIPDGIHGWYNTTIQLNDMDGYEVFTISNAERLDVKAPSKQYLKVLRVGLKDNYPEMTEDDIKRYLKACEGNENWDGMYE